MNKQCQNCGISFEITIEDSKFYEKIFVPPPTFCPECRLQRRSAWRNERTLYKRKCDAPGHNEEIISIYSADKPFKVYDQKYWWSDNWDPMDYGRDYDWNKPFFEQFRELLENVPLIHLSVSNNINSEYCNVSAYDKDCYMVSASHKNEGVFYSNHTLENKDCSDIYIGDYNELCYEIINCSQCYKLIFSMNCRACSHSIFLNNCVDCQNCFGCVNLRNKSYCIFNKQYTKEDYFHKLNSVDSGSFNNIIKAKSDYQKILIQSIKRSNSLKGCVNVTGDNVINAKNCLFCFDLHGKISAEDCKFLFWGGLNVKDSYDGGPGIGDQAEYLYECFDTGIKSSRLFFTSVVYGSYNVLYSINCHGASNLFGCYGLRHKQYCVLNKQYTKESFDKLRTKIIEHMNEMPYISKIQKSNLKNQNDKFSAQGGSAPGGKITKSKTREIIYRYGEFFPIELSPFAYNETVVQEYFPLTKEQALNKGYLWKEPEQRNYQIDIKLGELPDHIKDVKDDILDQIIECGHQGKCNENCTEAFKIIEPELEFYRKMNLPLPRLCPNCRHYQRIKQRNPLRLWHRKCQCGGKQSDNGVYQNTIEHFHHKQDHCPNEFETSYSPERPEIVYCEKCYLREVV